MSRTASRAGAVHGGAAQDQLETHGVQAADALGKGERPCDRDELGGPAVQHHVKPGGDAAREHSRIDSLLTGLIGRDLGKVEHVADVEPVAGDLDPGEAVDREVAQRMGLRGGRHGQAGDDSQQDDDLPHGVTPFRATGAHRIENRGLRASARR